MSILRWLITGLKAGVNERQQLDHVYMNAAHSRTNNSYFLIGTHSFRARESATAWTTRM